MADPISDIGEEIKPTVITSTGSYNFSYSSTQYLQTFQPYNSLITPGGIEIVGFPPKHEPTSTDQFYPTATTHETLSLSLSSSDRLSAGLIGQNVDSIFGHNRNDELQVMQLGHLQVRNSKYLGPAKELLIEFCNLEDDKVNVRRSSEWLDTDDLIKKQSLYSLTLLELHQRKAKLIRMLQEVHARYKLYCSQMKSMVQPFEAVAGYGAAAVYSGMASRAMSRHLRCLKDAILVQINATNKAIQDKDSTAVPGTTKGETPRLRILDQTLRQQRAFHQTNMMESHPWRPQRGLPERAVSVLRAWLFEHFLNPYPSDVDKNILAHQSGLSRSQVSNWFINARVRLWKPMVEQMYLQDLDEAGPLDCAAPNLHEQKPAPDPMAGMESDDCSLSSILNNSQGKARNKHHQSNNSCFSTAADEYGSIQFDFSSYSPYPSSAGGAAASTALCPKARHGGGGVSLTLGLHGGGGGGFSPASQGSLLFPRDKDCETGTTPYCSTSALFDCESQMNLVQYSRDLMGTHMLHDLAG